MLSHAQAPTIAKPSETTTTPITTCLLNLGTADLKSACYFAGHKMTNITLNAVSCTSTDNCEAVGDNYDSDYHMFAESWNGRSEVRLLLRRAQDDEYHSQCCLMHKHRQLRSRRRQLRLRLPHVC